MKYFEILALATYGLGMTVTCFILLWRNDDLANEIIQLEFERERIK